MAPQTLNINIGSFNDNIAGDNSLNGNANAATSSSANVIPLGGRPALPPPYARPPYNPYGRPGYGQYGRPRYDPYGQPAYGPYGRPEYGQYGRYPGYNSYGGSPYVFGNRGFPGQTGGGGILTELTRILTHGVSSLLG